MIGARGIVALGLAGIMQTAAAQDLSWSEIERGRYLAIASNCVSCHTDLDHDGTPWAGGREMETPFGVIVTPNITSDDATGIGRWTRDDFWRALHEGRRRDGSYMYPAFPYTHFTRMPRQDVDAIYEYLRTIPPVEADHVPEEELLLPLQVRTAISAWNALHFDQGVFVPDLDKSDEWNRGAYLVTGPGHCGACHTDRNILGGEQEDEFLRGATLENWHAPNIRGGEHGGIAHWSHDDIVAYLGSGRNEHTAPMTRMGEVVEFSTQHLTEGDLGAIATYLKSLEDTPRDASDPPEEAVLQAGQATYFDNCAACHHADGSGEAYMFARLAGSNKVQSDDPTTLIRIILEGAQAIPTNDHPGPLAMPAFDWKLDDDQIADLITYMRNAWGNKGPAVSASEVADLRETLGED
ncbi:c-type cytochrome [Yoonia sp.]|uniref:c-type cytochrome n=1 Tax=Yoonia sp. TaxID=2212373 RepID=UPI003A4D68C0